jgi:hypothetical protein
MSTLYPEKPVYDIPGFKSIKANDFIEGLKEQLEANKEDIMIQLNERVLSCLK